MPGRTTRLWIYNILNALLGVAVVYGVVNGEEAMAWLLVINAALGMAAANVPQDAIVEPYEPPVG